MSGRSLSYFSRRLPLRITQHVTRRIANPAPPLIPASSRSLRTTAQAREEDKSSVKAPEYLSEGERKIFDKLKAELSPSKLEVQDISGGCGSMYGLDVVSSRFAGLSVIKQHKLVNQILADEIKGWHGVQLKTKAE